MECFNIGSGGAVCEACSGVGVHIRLGVDGIEIMQTQLMPTWFELQIRKEDLDKPFVGSDDVEADPRTDLFILREGCWGTLESFQ